jgi:hypothetical protein
MEGKAMRKASFLLLLAVVATAPVHAQSGAIHVICEDCRDPLAYPNDWANFAFNQIYGDDAWMDLDQADDFWVHNLDGDRVYVDVDFVMEGIKLLGNELPLWPANMVLITLALPDGQILEVLRSVFMTPLPVPAPSGPDMEPESTGSTDGGDDSGNDGVDDPDAGDEEEPWEQPEVDIFGFTGIEDPDADGEFTDTDWCEEC